MKHFMRPLAKISIALCLVAAWRSLRSVVAIIPRTRSWGRTKATKAAIVSRVDARLSPRHVGTPYARRRPGEEVAAPFTPGHKEASKTPRGKSAAWLGSKKVQAHGPLESIRMLALSGQGCEAKYGNIFSFCRGSRRPVRMTPALHGLVEAIEGPHLFPSLSNKLEAGFPIATNAICFVQ
ncbi:hypothetical protein V8D89_010299 [Ganoderma adspersum]